MADTGLIFVCVGCCCGRDGHGGALAPQRALRLAVTRAYKKSDLSGRVRLVFSDCLGPCSESNVILLYLHGQPLWFRRMNTADLLTALMNYVRAALDRATVPLPSSLAARSFSWTGGGVGPQPPIADVEPATATVETVR